MAGAPDGIRVIGCGQHIEIALFAAASKVIGREAQIVNGVPAVREGLPINCAVVKRHRCGYGRSVGISPPLRSFAWFAERCLPKSALDNGIADIFNAHPAASGERFAVVPRPASPPPASIRRSTGRRLPSSVTSRCARPGVSMPSTSS